MKKMFALVLTGILLFAAACTPAHKSSPTTVSTLETTTALAQTEGNSQEKASTRVLKDANGREVEIPVKLERVVCLGVGCLRFTSYLQATDKIVGVEDNEHKPSLSKPFDYVYQETFKSLPVIGTNGKAFDEELVKLQPQLIVTSIAVEDARALQEKLQIPVFTLPIIDNLVDGREELMLRLLGEVYGKQERAEELIRYMQGLKKELDDALQGLKEEEKRTAYAAGISFKGIHGFEGTEAQYAPFVLAHVKNVADGTGQKRPFNVDLEQVLAWNPDLLFIDWNGWKLIQEDYQKNPEYYKALSAVRQQKTYSQISFRSFAMNLERRLKK